MDETAAAEPSGWTIRDVDGGPELLDRMKDAESIRDWSLIVGDHLAFGNAKLADSIAIFNIGSATDCVNIGTDHCQVPAEDCYAYRSEHTYPHTLGYRRRQEYLWDCLDPETFADAFLAVVDRKRKPVDALRFNQSGDFRFQGDVVRADRVAERLADEGVRTYTYSASDFLDWSEADHLVLNASNPWVEDADQRYEVVEDPADIPADGFVCPATTDDLKCGDCLACLVPGGADTVYEHLRT